MTTNQQLSPRDFDQIYTFDYILGRGGFGTVYSGYRNKDGLQVAIKKVEKSRVRMVNVRSENNNHNSNIAGTENRHEILPLEVHLMRKTMHISGVIKLIEYYELPNSYYLVMERIGSSLSRYTDLFHLITHNGPLKEDFARCTFKQVVDTVYDCFKVGVIHGDIKDENILIDEARNKIKLIDFGSGEAFHGHIYTEYHGKFEFL